MIKINVYLRGKHRPITLLTSDETKFDFIHESLSKDFIKLGDIIINCKEIRYITKEEK